MYGVQEGKKQNKRKHQRAKIRVRGTHKPRDQAAYKPKTTLLSFGIEDLALKL